MAGINRTARRAVRSEWKVLTENDGIVTVISKYALASTKQRNQSVGRLKTEGGCDVTAKKKNRKTVLVAAVAVAVVLGGIFWGMGKPARDYKKAQALMDAGQYNQAQTAFEALGSYQDSAQKAKDAQKKQEENQSAYQQAQALMDFGQYPGAAIAFSKLGDYQDSEERAQEARGKQQIASRIAGYNHTVGLRSDGTVVAVGENDHGQCNVSGWRDIVAVSAGVAHTVGLRRDGTVVAVGHNSDGRCDVSDWSDIVAVAAGYNHTVGLRRDGTVIAAGNNGFGQCDVSGWTNIRIPSE